MKGTLLGNRYEIIEKIGEGGMAKVYKAKDRFLNRYVAVKILKNEHANNQEFVQKFETEAKAVASLSNNHIVTIYDVGNQDNIHYIVMEYIDGKTLKEVINEKGKLDYKETIDISIQIAQALNNAHTNNIIHRDIKPHNILIKDGKLAKVTDFGIARVSNYSTITNTKKVIGSAHYFSPEQAKGSYVDNRSDIYSLGIMMYEMVTGVLPFDGDTPVAIALKHLEGKVKPPIELSPDIPESLNNAILKCIEKEPIKRYQNTIELINDLKYISNDMDVDIDVSNIDDDYTKVMDPVSDDTSEIKNDNNFVNKRRSKNSNKRRKKLGIIVVTMLVIISAIGIVLNYYFSHKSGNDEVVIPNIVGVNKDEAQNMIENSGLRFKIDGVDASDKPVDEVLSCNPNIGTKVKKNSYVKVRISSGNKMVNVPDLTNLNILAAKDEIENSKLNVGDISYEFSEIVPKDEVISQYPKANTNCNEGDNVDLVISKGSKDGLTIVPDLKGKDIEEAKAILQEKGLEIGQMISIKTNDKNKDGLIFNQSVPAEKEVPNGTIVSVSYFNYNNQRP